jgi:hypothetical protein
MTIPSFIDLLQSRQDARNAFVLRAGEQAKQFNQINREAGPAQKAPASNS